MEYLTVDDLKEKRVVEYKDAHLLLLQPAGEMTTFIDEADDKDDGEKIDTSARVFIRQRWKVSVLPPDRFTPEFITHRYIEVYYCLYGDLLNEQEKVYTAWDVLPHNEIDSNSLGDDFKDIY